MRSWKLALILVLTASVAMAQDGSWAEHIRNGEWYFTAGRMDRAEAELQAALTIANTFKPGDVRLERTLEDLGKLAEHEGRDAEAQSRYQLQLAAAELRLGKDSPKLLDVLAAVGRTALKGGDIPTARDAFERYATIGLGSQGADPDQLRIVLATLARMEVLAGQEAQALEHQRQVVKLLDSGAPSNADGIAALRTLAGLELRQGSAQNAEADLERAAALAAEPEDDQAVAVTPAGVYANGASVAAGAGELDMAHRLAEKALASTPGATAKQTALTTLADVSWLAVRRSGATLEELFGTTPDDPKVAEARTRLDQLNAAQEAAGTEAAARIPTLQHLVQVTAMQGDATACLQTLETLAALSGGRLPAPLAAARPGLLEAAGRTQEALEANTAAMTSVEATDGTRSPKLLPLLERQERLLRAAGQKREARRAHKRIKKLRRRLHSRR